MFKLRHKAFKGVLPTKVASLLISAVVVLFGFNVITGVVTGGQLMGSSAKEVNTGQAEGLYSDVVDACKSKITKRGAINSWENPGRGSQGSITVCNDNGICYNGEEVMAGTENEGCESVTLSGCDEGSIDEKTGYRISVEGETAQINCVDKDSGD